MSTKGLERQKAGEKVGGRSIAVQDHKADSKKVCVSRRILDGYVTVNEILADQGDVAF